MSTSVNLEGSNLYYRVNHPEFDPTIAYKALAYIDYGESAWSQLLFVTENGLTYCVKVKRCLNLNAIAEATEQKLRFSVNGPVVTRIDSETLRNAPWPKPKARNPDLEDD